MTLKMHSYWDQFMEEYEGNKKYRCPNGCVTSSGNPKKLTPKEVKKEGDNKGRFFLSCNDRSYNGSRPGCGMFAWCDEEASGAALSKSQAPIFTDGQSSLKRARTDCDEGTVARGSIAAMPDKCHEQFAEMGASISRIEASLEVILCKLGKN